MNCQKCHITFFRSIFLYKVYNAVFFFQMTMLTAEIQYGIVRSEKFLYTGFNSFEEVKS
jgi:hypothetical protein